MTVQRWPGHESPNELGAVAHGPAILAGSAFQGVVAGLRCVFAHPTGLHLPVVVAALGIRAEAARRRTQPTPGQPDRGLGSDLERALLVTVEVDGQSAIADPYRSQSSGSQEEFQMEAHYWIGQVPSDERIRITASWAAIGLPETTTIVTCGNLTDLANRVYPLR